VGNFCAVVVVLAALLPSVCHALAAEPTITHIKEIALHPGVNTVPGFGVNGETFTIVQAWRGNGNAHGYTDWLVLSPESEDNPFGVVGTMYEGGGPPRDLIRDEPFDGERRIGVIRFARATIDGKPHSILIDTQLDFDAGRPLADHEIATIRIFELTHTDGDVGAPPDLFALISTRRTTKRYCNAELALRDTLGLPLAKGDSETSSADGCL
jgi:hypothetical protein